ncbi:unnamed protein product, partial [Phaeothamnion confervicola]
MSLSSSIKPPLDTSALVRYFGATAFQWGGIVTFLAASQRYALPRLPAPVAKGAVAAFWAFMALRSRVFSPLNNARPGRDAERMVQVERRRPSWMPPPKAFPFIWMSIAGLRCISSTMVWEACGQRLVCAPLAAMALHLSVGDTWNTVNNVEKRLGAAVPGVFCVWLSLATTCVLYHRADSAAALVLLPSLCWITVANFLVRSIWSLNGKEPLYP